MSAILNTVLCKLPELSTLTYNRYVLNTFGRLFSCQGHRDSYFKKNKWHLPGSSLFPPLQQCAVNFKLWRLLAALCKHKLVFIDWCNISTHGTRRSIQGSAYSFKGNTEKTKTTQSRCCNKYVFYQLGVVVKCHGKFKGCSQLIF